MNTTAEKDNLNLAIEVKTALLSLHKKQIDFIGESIDGYFEATNRLPDAFDFVERADRHGEFLLSKATRHTEHIIEMTGLALMLGQSSIDFLKHLSREAKR